MGPNSTVPLFTFICLDKGGINNYTYTETCSNVYFIK